MTAALATSGAADAPREESLYCIPRPRVESALAQASRRPLVFVTANAGYGKTQAVRSFLQRQDASVIWLQLSESDTVGSRFWENLTHVIEAGAPALAAEMREFGFPDTALRFKRYTEILKKIAETDRMTYVVLDNFDELTNPQVVKFVERSVYVVNRRVRHIIISRKEPGMNVVPLFSKGRVSVVDEETLRFTEEETAEFFRWRGSALRARALPEIHGETHGWALALQLLALALQRSPGQLQAALHTMRLNLFKLMEREAFEGIPENIQKFAVKLSLVSKLPLAPLRELAAADAAFFYRTNPQAAAFVWLDNLTGQLQVHPLYLEFLKTKEGLLSEEEKREVYRWAAGWCMRNQIYSDAMEFYAKLKDYLGVQSVLLTYPLTFPRDMAQFFLQTLEGLEDYDPRDETLGGVTLMMLKGVFIPSLLMDLGRYDEARRGIQSAILEWGEAGASHAALLAFSSHNNLAFLNMHTCAASNEYTFAAHFKKAMEYHDGQMPISPGAYSYAEIDSYACLVGENARRGDLDRFLAAARAAVPCISRTIAGLYSGYDDLAACEIACYRGQTDQAKHYAYRAIQSASAKKQYSIEAFAQYYLMNMALLEGDYAIVVQLLQQFRSWLDMPEFRHRQLLYDLFTGFFYGQIELPQLAAPWLLSGAAEDVDPGAPSRETIIRVKYLISAKKYHIALGMLAKLEQEWPEKRFLFGEIARSLLTAVARHKSGNAAGAVTALERAWRLSFSGELEMQFIMLGRDMCDLAAAALKREECAIPKEWLKYVSLRASGCAKKVAAVAAAYKRDNHIKDDIRLSQRSSSSSAICTTGFRARKSPPPAIFPSTPSRPRSKCCIQSWARRTMWTP